MIMRCIVPLVCATVLFLNPAISVAQQSQSQQQQPSQQQAAPPERADEILVVGRLDAGNPPVKTEQTPVIGQAGRALASEAERFQRCAKLPSRADLHQIVDRGPADFVAEGALHDYIARNQACYIGYPGPPTPPSPFFGDCNPHVDGDMFICRAVYDRGAIFERVLKNIGDPLVSAAQLKIDEPTLARFLLRQEGRGKQSVSADRRYFGVVACMVGINPIAAGQMLRSGRGSRRETTARQILIGYAKTCLPGAAVVKVDPGQFRAYTAEALYNWLAAAANRSSLVI